MAYIKKCDRCGACRESLITHIEVSIPQISCETREYDLCDECSTELEYFMRGAKPGDLNLICSFDPCKDSIAHIDELMASFGAIHKNCR